MDLALQRDRPAWTEVVAVLMACAVLLVVLVELDGAAASRENERARVALAERAREARQARAEQRTPEPAPVAVQPPGRTESLGDRGPITIPIGGAWGAGTASSVGNRQPAPAPTATPELRRIVGPIQSAATWRDARPVTAAPAPAPVAAPVRGEHGSLALFLVGALGAIMSAAGALMLSHGRAQPPVGVTR